MSPAPSVASALSVMPGDSVASGLPGETDDEDTALAVAEGVTDDKDTAPAVAEREMRKEKNTTPQVRPSAPAVAGGS